MKKNYGHLIAAGSGQARAFTLVEVVVGVALLAIILTSALVAFHKTTDGVWDQTLKERAGAVAQRHIELLLTSLQEPNSAERSGQDEWDPMFAWELDLQRESMDASPATLKSPVKVTVTVAWDPVIEGSASEIALVRYFPATAIKPIPGYPVTVPVTQLLEDPDWYVELVEELGREPTFEETIKKMLGDTDLPLEFPDYMEDAEESEPSAQERTRTEGDATGRPDAEKLLDRILPNR